ncbi:MAG: cell division protein ZapA [bacterium]|nr:cell division protein ZapA [bacterium]MCP5069927.1 cell division protein ZapA [bacterium]
MPVKRVVAVTILGQEYKVRGEADPASVQRAAALLDETMCRVRERAGTVDSVDIAVLAALNLANRLIALHDESEAGFTLDESRLDDLLGLVQAAVDVPPVTGPRA